MAPGSREASSAGWKARGHVACRPVVLRKSRRTGVGLLVGAYLVGRPCARSRCATRDGMGGEGITAASAVGGPPRGRLRFRGTLRASAVPVPEGRGRPGPQHVDHVGPGVGRG